MSKWLLYLLFSPLLTPAERQTLRQYYRQQRASFCERHLVREMTPEEEQLDRELRRQEGRDE